MATTPILHLPLLDPSQAQPHIPINEALTILDSAAGGGGGSGITVIDSDTSPEVIAHVTTLRFSGATVEEGSDGVAVVTVAGGGGGSLDIVDVAAAGAFGWSMAASSFNHAITNFASGGATAGVTPSGNSLQAQRFYSANTGTSANGYAMCYNGTAGSGVYRKMSGSNKTGGFRMILVGGWDCPGHQTDFNSSNVFFGVMNSIVSIGATDPSTFADGLGVCHDSGDTNLQWLTNDGSTPTKVDAGVTASALGGHLLHLEILVPADGSTAKLTLTDIDTGSVYTHTFSTGLPAQDVVLTVTAGVGNLANLHDQNIYLNRIAYRMNG